MLDRLVQGGTARATKPGSEWAYGTQRRWQLAEKGIRQLAIPVLVLSSVLGCETFSPEDAIEDLMEAGGLERWGCGDRFEGCGFLRECPVQLTADFHDGTGTVEFARTINYARFEVRGLSRRWDWCLEDGAFECAFVIDTEGHGSYYDFGREMADPDGARRAKPTEIFKCTARGRVARRSDRRSIHRCHGRGNEGMVARSRLRWAPPLTHHRSASPEALDV